MINRIDLTEKDTNSDDIRLERAKRQYEFEKKLKEETRGKHFFKRHAAIREALWGSQRPDDYEVQSLVTREKHNPDYPNPELVKKLYIPQIQDFMDQAYDRIENSEQGFRLATISYFLNILAHQYNDGNGQTNRLASLSYIREFCPQYDGHFFPIKYASDYEKDTSQIDWSLPTFSKPLVENLTCGLPYNLEPEDRKIYEFISKFKIDKDEYLEIGLDDEPADEKTKGIAMQFNVNLKNLKNAGIEVDAIDTVQHMDTKVNIINRKIRDVLEERYPGYFFNPYRSDIPGSMSLDHQKKSFILTSLLYTPQGINALFSYLYNGSDFSKSEEYMDPRLRDVLERTMNSLSIIENGFKDVLQAETTKVHEEKYNSKTI